MRERHCLHGFFRNHTDDLLSTKIVALYQGIVLWMLKWVDAGCLLTIYTNGWKSVPAKSVQLFELLRLRLCLFSPILHFSVAWVAREKTVTEPTTLVSFLRVAEAQVCDAMEARVSVALRVRSYSCPRHIDCNDVYQICR